MSDIDDLEDDLDTFHDTEDEDGSRPTLAGEDALDPRRVIGELEEIPYSVLELEKVPRRLWEQTLAPLHMHQRYSIAQRVADPRLREIASCLAFKLDMDDCDRRNARDEAHHKARRTGYPLPTPSPGHAVTRRTVQVNIRLRADDHARLAEAADRVGLKPTTLARALVLNGAGRILQEHAPSTAR